MLYFLGANLKVKEDQHFKYKQQTNHIQCETRSIDHFSYVSAIKGVEGHVTTNAHLVRKKS